MHSTIARKRILPSNALGDSAAAENPGAMEPPIAPPAQALRNFYDALAALSSGHREAPVTILHLGDDLVSDDKFAGAMREHLQSRFGNAGRGMMLPGLFPMRGIKADRGGQWTFVSAAGNAPARFGLTGVRLSAFSPDAWIRLNSMQGAFDWVEVTFAAGPKQGTAIVVIDGDAKLVPTDARAEDQATIRVTAKAREILIKPKGDGEITLLSVTTGVNAPGIRYVNLGLPGATAAMPSKWNPEYAASDFQKLRPDLVILGYGAREGFQDGLDIAQYEAQFGWLIKQLGRWAPQASILIVSPPDAARLPSFAGSGGAQVCRALNAQEIAGYDRLLKSEDERLGRWHAPPKLEAVRAVQRRVASAAGAFFWDWSKFMGGPCSIRAWATARPRLAAPDHLTLTQAGMERSARALFAEIIAGFEAYRSSAIASSRAKAEPPVAEPAKKAKKKSKTARKGPQSAG